MRRAELKTLVDMHGNEVDNLLCIIIAYERALSKIIRSEFSDYERAFSFL